MLGKLIKHEFKATGKSFVLLFGATLALTIFSKIGMNLPFDNFIWRIIIGVAAVGCVFCIFAGFIVAFVIMIYRFYNNMLKDEGYLSHTLPVKSWQHLISKLVTDLVWLLASIAVSFLSLFIIYVMEVLLCVISYLSCYPYPYCSPPRPPAQQAAQLHPIH